VFSHPPLAGVGMTESQARNRLGAVKTYTSDFRPMKNVLAGRNERSLYKLVVNAETEEVVGIHMIGPEAPEILQAAAIAVKAKLKKSQFDEVVALHPSMAQRRWTPDQVRGDGLLLHRRRAGLSYIRNSARCGTSRCCSRRSASARRPWPY
jgi:hypothetical protein